MIVNKYQEIIDKLIEKSFSSLKDEKIIVKIKPLKKGSMFAKGVITQKLKLLIDPIKYRDAKENELVGCLAHELVHFEYFMRPSLFYRLVNYFKYNLSRKFAHDAEINTDKETIRRGYARELYANRKFRLRKCTNKDKKIITNYLTPDEIKLYAKEIGKW